MITAFGPDDAFPQETLNEGEKDGRLRVFVGIHVPRDDVRDEFWICRDNLGRSNEEILRKS